MRRTSVEEEIQDKPLRRREELRSELHCRWLRCVSVGAEADKYLHHHRTKTPRGGFLEHWCVLCDSDTHSAKQAC